MSLFRSGVKFPETVDSEDGVIPRERYGEVKGQE